MHTSQRPWTRTCIASIACMHIRSELCSAGAGSGIGSGSSRSETTWSWRAWRREGRRGQCGNRRKVGGGDGRAGGKPAHAEPLVKEDEPAS